MTALLARDHIQRTPKRLSQRLERIDASAPLATLNGGNFGRRHTAGVRKRFSKDRINTRHLINLYPLSASVDTTNAIVVSSLSRIHKPRIFHGLIWQHLINNTTRYHKIWSTNLYIISKIGPFNYYSFFNLQFSPWEDSVPRRRSIFPLIITITFIAYNGFINCFVSDFLIGSHVRRKHFSTHIEPDINCRSFACILNLASYICFETFNISILIFESNKRRSFRFYGQPSTVSNSPLLLSYYYSFFSRFCSTLSGLRIRSSCLKRLDQKIQRSPTQHGSHDQIKHGQRQRSHSNVRSLSGSIRRLPLSTQIRVPVVTAGGTRRNGRIGLNGPLNLTGLNGVDHLDLGHLRRSLLRSPCSAANDNHSGHQDRTHPNFHENHPSNLQPTLFLTRGRNRRKSVPVSVKTTGMRICSRTVTSARSAAGTHVSSAFSMVGRSGEPKGSPFARARSANPLCSATLRFAADGRVHSNTSRPTMKTSASGAAPPRPDTPHISPHYALTDDVHYELSQLFCALDMIADLAEGTPNDLGTELESRHYAPLFRTLAFYGHRLMADIPHTSDLRSAA